MDGPPAVWGASVRNALKNLPVDILPSRAGAVPPPVPPRPAPGEGNSSMAADPSVDGDAAPTDASAESAALAEKYAKREQLLQLIQGAMNAFHSATSPDDLAARQAELAALEEEMESLLPLPNDQAPATQIRPPPPSPPPQFPPPQPPHPHFHGHLPPGPTLRVENVGQEAQIRRRHDYVNGQGSRECLDMLEGIMRLVEEDPEGNEDMRVKLEVYIEDRT